ncbi:hypothetical protein EDC26_107133 [Paralcaligenes ureilyticus]|uniref:Uncharacterized protein n=1 Tax=Paralcaligenes ureilyticus TaxID=627131 RepID=A0A4R3M6D3_9BURK|nr:hypothetical protein EDC26_107133 [Paralcaligenes ureilyticus]
MICWRNLIVDIDTYTETVIGVMARGDVNPE